MRNELRDVDSGMIALFIYLCLILFSAYGFVDTVDFCNIESPFNTLIVVGGYRIFVVGTYFLYCLPNIFFASIAAKKDNHRIISNIFLLLFFVSFFPIYFFSKRMIKLEYICVPDKNIAITDFQFMINYILYKIIYLFADKHSYLFILFIIIELFYIPYRGYQLSQDKHRAAVDIYYKRKWEEIINKKAPELKL
ncbi:MAG TPA: hypothetical protein EYP86_02640 [Candidatus Altiarchaeales archaeon]|nr:hypothetical protein [Candidatus Altiarchaeales archaeon]